MKLKLGDGSISRREEIQKLADSWRKQWREHYETEKSPVDDPKVSLVDSSLIIDELLETLSLVEKDRDDLLEIINYVERVLSANNKYIYKKEFYDAAKRWEDKNNPIENKIF